MDTLKFIHLLKLSIAHSILNIKRRWSTILGSNNDADQTDESLNLKNSPFLLIDSFIGEDEEN